MRRVQTRVSIGATPGCAAIGASAAGGRRVLLALAFMRIAYGVAAFGAALKNIEAKKQWRNTKKIAKNGKKQQKNEKNRK